MRRELFRYLEVNKRSAISLASELIGIPTVNPPGEGYEEMIAVLERECKELGLETKKHLTPENVLHRFGIKGGSKRISLVADWKVDSNKTLHVNSHYDVVPATDKWETDPFKPVIIGNRIYGRGSEDMKGNIACVLYALHAMKKIGVRPKINLQFSFTPDEETGGMTGLGYLVGKDMVKADYAVSEGYAGGYVSMGNKGVLWAEVTIRGKAAHASMPHKGVNAFERMTSLVNEFSKLKRMVCRRKTGYDMRDDVSRSPSFVMGGLLEGGVKINVVPDLVRFSIDRRLIPEEDEEAVKNEINEVIKTFNKRYEDSSAHVRFTSKGRASISRKDDIFFKSFADSIRLVNGKQARFSVMAGATDMRYFMWKGVPSLGYSARGGELWHSDNEFVYIDSLIDTAKVYALVMTGME